VTAELARNRNPDFTSPAPEVWRLLWFNPITDDPALNKEKGMNIAAGVAAGIVGAFYGMHAFMIASGQQMQRQTAEAIHINWNTYRLIALPEAAAAIGLLVGIWFKPLALAAAIGLTLLMIGAAAFRARAGQDKKLVAGDLVIAVVAAGVAVLQFRAI
jgi:hypothetical protein